MSALTIDSNNNDKGTEYLKLGLSSRTCALTLLWHLARMGAVSILCPTGPFSHLLSSCVHLPLSKDPLMRLVLPGRGTLSCSALLLVPCLTGTERSKQGFSEALVGWYLHSSLEKILAVVTDLAMGLRDAS